MSEFTETAKELKRAYMKKWRARNPERVAVNNQRYWEKKAQALQAAEA